MKIPLDIIGVWLEIMSEEELVRFRKRLQMNLKSLKKENREALIELFSAEIKKRHSQK